MELYLRLRRLFETEPYALEALEEIKSIGIRVGIWLMICEAALIT
jgi:hypothetical protein